MHLGWKSLIPLAIINLMITGAWLIFKDDPSATWSILKDSF